jgi:hypothetical protein
MPAASATLVASRMTNVLRDLYVDTGLRKSIRETGRSICPATVGFSQSYPVKSGGLSDEAWALDRRRNLGNPTQNEGTGNSGGHNLRRVNTILQRQDRRLGAHETSARSRGGLGIPEFDRKHDVVHAADLFGVVCRGCSYDERLVRFFNP